MFYSTLLSLCRAHGTTVTALARSLNIAKGSPSNWQRGASPNSDVVVKIARHFGVSCDYLLGLDDVPSRREDFSLNGEEQRLVLSLRAAPEPARQAAVASVYAILQAMPDEDRSPGDASV